jgi:hypothetical protein
MSTDEREDRDVDEAEWRGESEGETAADDSESVAVAEVTVRLRTGLLGREDPDETVVDAMVMMAERGRELKAGRPSSGRARVGDISLDPLRRGCCRHLQGKRKEEGGIESVDER